MAHIDINNDFRFGSELFNECSKLPKMLFHEETAQH